MRPTIFKHKIFFENLIKLSSLINEKLHSNIVHAIE